MKKIFKKSLALMVSAALCLTAFVGCLTVNAEETAPTNTATLTVGSKEITKGTTTVTVPVTLQANDSTEIAAARFSLVIDSSVFTFTDVIDNCVVVPKGAKYDVSVSTTDGSYPSPKSGNTYIFLVEATKDGSGEDTATVTSATFDLVLTVDAAAAAGTYAFAGYEGEDPKVAILEACDLGTATNVNEQLVYGPENEVVITPTFGSVTIKAAHTHSFTELKYNETYHWYECPDDKKISEAGQMEHKYGEGVVTKEPTETETGIRTYTCSVCGYSYTEDIPVLVEDTSIGSGTDIEIKENVSVRLRVSKTHIAAKYSDFKVVVDYDYYVPASNFLRQSETKTYSSREFKDLSSSVLYANLNCQAMYELNLPLKITFYFMNADGEVVAYKTALDVSMKEKLLSTMPTLASNSSKQANCKQIVDLVNYATALQNRFGDAGSDLAAAEKINVGFEDYQEAYASTETEFSYNTTYDKDVSADFNGKAQFTISTSNCAYFSFGLKSASSYTYDQLKLGVTYTSGFNNSVVSVSDIPATSIKVSANACAYEFSQLALYDLNKTVTATVYLNDGTPLYNISYSLEQYISTRLDTTNPNYVQPSDAEREMLIAAMRFSISCRAANGIAN